MATDKGRSGDVSTNVLEANVRRGPLLRTPEELATIVSQFASSDGWINRVRLLADRRWYERLYQDSDYDIWVISWLPGQSTGFHDHGDSAGAFVVAIGTLQEHRPGQAPHAIKPGMPRAFGPDYRHDVRNESPAPAISIHAYSPPLSEMNEYELEESRLVPRERPFEQDGVLDEDWRMGARWKGASLSGTSGIEQVLSAARGRLDRLTPHQVHEAVDAGKAILVDIRPEAQRAVEGSIPGTLIVERNVLEWRFDPSSSARLPIATDHHLQVIVFCSEGYTSSLAAAALQDIGLYRATDMIGGFHAWQAASLRIVPPSELP